MLEFSGIEAALSKLRETAKRAATAKKRALLAEAHAIRRKSLKYVPIDFGILKGSAIVEPIEEHSDGSVSTTIGYGGDAGAYALAVHEHPSGHSPPSWKGVEVKFSGAPERGPKYLERAMNEAMDGMTERIGERVGKYLAEGTSDESGGGSNE